MALTTGPQATSPVPASLLAGKVVVISGVGPDLGRAIALRSAQAGADLVLAARTAARLENVAKEVTALGRRAAPVPTDITDEDSAGRLAEAALAAFGHVDTLVNNAFTIPPRPPPPTPTRVPSRPRSRPTCPAPFG